MIIFVALLTSHLGVAHYRIYMTTLQIDVSQFCDVQVERRLRSDRTTVHLFWIILSF